MKNKVKAYTERGANEIKDVLLDPRLNILALNRLTYNDYKTRFAPT